MQKTPFETPLRQCIRAQVEGLGRVFARYQVPDGVVWEALRELELPYQGLRKALAGASLPVAPLATTRQPAPHPAVLQMLEKLDGETSR